MNYESKVSSLGDVVRENLEHTEFEVKVEYEKYILRKLKTYE